MSSMIIPSLKDYLSTMGIDENTPTEQINYHKAQHRKLYQRAYAIEWRKRVIRMEQVLSKSEHRKIKQFAKRYKRKSLNRFILDCALAYLEDEYIQHDEELVQQYLYQIRAIGNNVNQVVHQLHRTKQYTHKGAYQHLKDKVDELVDTVNEFMNQPPKLRPALEKLFMEVPESIEDFERFLETMKTKIAGHDNQDNQ